MCVKLVTPSLWDGGPKDRHSWIVTHSPPRDKHLVSNFLDDAELLQCITMEAIKGFSIDSNSPTHVTDPVTVLTRYRDNIYIILLNIPHCMHDGILVALEAFLKGTYGIPLKWEPISVLTPWGISKTGVQEGHLRLLRKGTVLDLATDSTKEWDKWIPHLSPNAHQVVSAMVPNLMIQSLWYASCLRDLLANFRSLVWGLTVKGYPTSWWVHTVHTFLQQHALKPYVTPALVRLWMGEGYRHRHMSVRDSTPPGDVLNV